MRETGGAFEIEEGRLFYCKERGERRIIHTFEPWEDELITRFDGRSNIGCIAADFAGAHALEPELAYQQVKLLFIALCSYMVFRPAGLTGPPPGAVR